MRNNKQFLDVLNAIKKNSKELIHLVEKAQTDEPDKMGLLAIRLESWIIEKYPKLNPAEVRIFSELITGTSGEKMRERTNQVSDILDAHLPDCFRSFCALEQIQKTNEDLHGMYRALVKEWIDNGGKDNDGTIENRMAFLRSLTAINNNLIPIPTKEIKEKKKNNFYLKISN